MKSKSNADLIQQPKTGRKLTPKESLFCRCVIDCFYNLTQAALMAGYSERYAREIGSQNYAKLHIKEEIERLERESELSAQVSKTAIARFQRNIILDKKTEPSERQRAIQSLIDMYGYDAPVKHDILIDTPQKTTTIEIVHSVIEDET